MLLLTGGGVAFVASACGGDHLTITNPCCCARWTLSGLYRDQRTLLPAVCLPDIMTRRSDESESLINDGKPTFADGGAMCFVRMFCPTVEKIFCRHELPFDCTHSFTAAGRRDSRRRRIGDSVSLLDPAARRRCRARRPCTTCKHRFLSHHQTDNLQGNHVEMDAA